MAAGKYDFVIEQGATFTVTLTYESAAGVAINLTNCDIRMQVRKNALDPTVLLELSITNGKITVPNPTLGQFRMRVSATETQAINWRAGAYDIEVIFQDGTVERILEGKVTIKLGVTR